MTSDVSGPAPASSRAGAAAPAIVATGLSKAFGKKVALDGVSLTVPRGSVFALLGPNGSGKTTLVQVLSTLRLPSAGSAEVLGHDLRTAPAEVRAGIGVTGQFSAVDSMLTGLENLLLMAKLYHLARDEGEARARSLLKRFDLSEAWSRPPSTYSGGMRRRLDIAMTLMGDPALIFLDEPTTGLDPRSRQTMWQIVREFVAEGVTVFLTTQYLQEADELADQIALLDHGRVVAHGTPAELKQHAPGAHITLRFATSAGLHAAARSVPGSTPDADAFTLRCPMAADGGAVKRVLDRVPDGLPIEDITVHTPDLDDVFFALSGTTPQTRTEDTARTGDHR
ncbi:ATP-binding cassette domain-containing protein [Streptomyces rugosispiralis]|uniref:ATP-binding cassette domain-containing protein n=1 Tax=Streptomyces rugosispiralis TaxID=2967341 RepID=A0ABT1VA77_9ACTN|nr:ATP-binding cassette domain-containing protein [Streptomyces rugosispiralis]MCQ8194305.1 ATP-binding cassette domain-containing protein [Streptomyces rugosispiralis]